MDCQMTAVTCSIVIICLIAIWIGRTKLLSQVNTKSFKSSALQNFLSLYYINPTRSESIDNDFKPVVLNYKIKELNSDNFRFSRTIPLVSGKEKQKSKNGKAVSMYDQPSPCNKRMIFFLHFILLLNRLLLQEVIWT